MYDARAATLRADDRALIVKADVPPYPNREHVDFLTFALERLGPPLGRRILEIGCGSGALATYLALRGARVTAVDVAAEMLEVGRRRAAVNGVSDRVSFIDTPFEGFASPDDAFDTVIGNQVLHHLELGEAMPGVARLLAPGGVAVFCEPVLFLPNAVRSVRDSRAVTWFFPERTDTPGERSLSLTDVGVISRSFGSMEMRPFQLSCRLQNFVELSDRSFARLERVDRFVLSHVRPAHRLCRYVVLVLQPGERVWDERLGADR